MGHGAKDRRDNDADIDDALLCLFYKAGHVPTLGTGYEVIIIKSSYLYTSTRHTLVAKQSLQSSYYHHHAISHPQFPSQ